VVHKDSHCTDDFRCRGGEIDIESDFDETDRLVADMQEAYQEQLIRFDTVVAKLAAAVKERLNEAATLSLK